MKFNSICFFQGFDSHPGIKDPTKTYYEVSLLDDVDQLRCSTSQEVFDKVLPGIPKFASCKCTFELNVRYNSFKLLDIVPVK